MVQAISWILMFNTTITMWLAGNGNKWAWILGIASQSVWVWLDIQVGAYGLLPLAVILTVVYGRNLRKSAKGIR